MKKKLLHMLRVIVGPEYGFDRQGNTQWYYVLSIGIDIMLSWIWFRELAPSYTILALLHLMTVNIYGLCKFEDLDIQYQTYKYTIIYLLSHGMILILALYLSRQATLRFSAISIVFVLAAPDGVGNTVITEMFEDFDEKVLRVILMIENTVVLALYTMVVTMLPVTWWIKLIIVVITIALHWPINYLQREGADIVDITWGAVISLLY